MPVRRKKNRARPVLGQALQISGYMRKLTREGCGYSPVPIQEVEGRSWNHVKYHFFQKKYHI